MEQRKDREGLRERERSDRLLGFGEGEEDRADVLGLGKYESRG